jgi:phage tail sheath protein FI
MGWGNRTAAYPGVTDVKDTFVPLRRMFSFVGNTLVTTAWQLVDRPLNRRLAGTVCDTFNVWLNGLARREFLLGGRVEFLSNDNPTTDLMDGIARFHVFFTPPSPARELDFILEYDPAYIQTLFATAA